MSIGLFAEFKGALEDPQDVVRVADRIRRGFSTGTIDPNNDGGAGLSSARFLFRLSSCLLRLTSNLGTRRIC